MAAANYSSDYSTLTHSLAASNHLLSSGQHLLQDTYKSMLPGAAQTVGASFGLHPAGSAPSPTSGGGGLPPQVPSPRSQRRYFNRFVALFKIFMLTACSGTREGRLVTARIVKRLNV